MNLVGLGLILISCHVWIIETNGSPVSQDASTQFQEFLEEFKNILKEGNSSLGIPILDPFNRERLPVHIEDIIDLDATFTDISIEGLSEYVVNDGCSFTVLPKPQIIVNIGLSFKARTDYENMKGKFLKYDFSGDTGDIDMSVTNLNFAVIIDYTLIPRDTWYMEILSAETKLSLEELSFHVKGLFNNDDASNIMSWIISKFMPHIIEEKQEDIIPKLNENIKNMINNLVTSRWTFQQILDMLGIEPFGYANALALLQNNHLLEQISSKHLSDDIYI